MSRTKRNPRNLSGPEIYESGFVATLFDRMASTYDLVNFLTSFGFSERWRSQFVARAAIRPGTAVYDLMCGQGECWGSTARQAGQTRLIALDISQEMLRGAARRTSRHPQLRVGLSRQNALRTGFPDGCADSVICAFGVKTLSADQQDQFAGEIARLLKPGGTFSIIEVSVPRGWMFERPYMFYLKKVIPLLGSVLLGDPQDYRMLGVYTERFADCQGISEALSRRGLDVTYHAYFFGCASGVSGTKGRPEHGA